MWAPLLSKDAQASRGIYHFALTLLWRTIESQKSELIVPRAISWSFTYVRLSMWGGGVWAVAGLGCNHSIQICQPAGIEVACTKVWVRYQGEGISQIWLQIRNPGEKLYRKSYFRRFRRYVRYGRYEQDVTDVTDVTCETSEVTFTIQFFTRIQDSESAIGFTWFLHTDTVFTSY